MNNADLPHIAIVEDTSETHDNLEFFLRSQGHIVWRVASPAAFCRQFVVTRTDIAVVNIDLPGAEALPSAVSLQSQAAPFGLIALTWRGDPDTRMMAMQNGADHCLVKPVDTQELYVTIQAMWRRLRAPFSQEQVPQRYTPAPCLGVDAWTYDPLARTLARRGASPMPLTVSENLLVGLLAERPNELHTKQQILDALYRGDLATDFHRVEVTLNRLRQKARKAGMALPIRSVFGKGLVFAAECIRMHAPPGYR